MRKDTNKSKQLITYGGVSFVTFILTILVVAYPSFDGRISSVFGYLGSGLFVWPIYVYREKYASTRDSIVYVFLGWLFSAGALFIGLIGYVRNQLEKFS
jgi:hypothetical protein